MHDDSTTLDRPILPRMVDAATRVLTTTRRDWQRAGGARLTPRAPASTFAPSLTAAAGETGPRTSASGQAPAPKVYRPGNSQAKGPQRIGLSGE
jgi:hypothetical protein